MYIITVLYYNLLNPNAQMAMVVGFNVRLEAQMKVNQMRLMRSLELESNPVRCNHLRRILTITRPLAIRCSGTGVLHVFVVGVALAPTLEENTSKQKPQS